jgi:hypothetical protein
VFRYQTVGASSECPLDLSGQNLGEARWKLAAGYPKVMMLGLGVIESSFVTRAAGWLLIRLAAAAGQLLCSVIVSQKQRFTALLASFVWRWPGKRIDSLEARSMLHADLFAVSACLPRKIGHIGRQLSWILITLS